MAGPVFRAAFDGECAECFADICEGDEARYNDDGEVIGQECCGQQYDVDFDEYTGVWGRL